MDKPTRPDRPRGLRYSAVLRVLLPLAVVIAAAEGVFWLYLMKPRQEETRQTPVAPVNVRVEVVRAIPEMPDTFELPAVIEAHCVVTVSAEVAGRVEKIACREGRTCRKGDLLVALNSDLLQAAFDCAKAQADYDRAQHARIRKLHAGGAVTDQDLDQATACMAISKAAVDAARAELVRTRILAPTRGTLDDLMVEEGEYVQAGTPVAKIVDVDAVKVVVQVPERDVPFLKTGDATPVFATVRGAETKVGSTVSFISEIANPDTRASRVEIAVDNRKRLLRSGQIVRVRLTRRVLRNAVMIPLLAVIPQENSKAVYVVEDGKAQRREVTLGIIRGTRIQIRRGLEEGDRLIVAGHRFVGPGQRIRIVEETDAPTDPSCRELPASAGAGGS